MKVTWKSGSQYKVDAAVAHQEIEALRQKLDGDVTAADLVAHAKSKRSKLHGEFEWDDTVAAHEFRCEQGRRMLRSIVVKRTELTTDQPQRVYEVVRIAAQSEGEKSRKVYRSMEAVMADPDTRQQVLQRALQELIAFQRRYRALQELAVVHRSIDEVLQSVQV